MFEEYTRRTWVDTNGDISPEQTEYATNLRIPILTSAYPRWNYITGIVVCDNILDHGVMPTEEEIAAIAAQLQDYCTNYHQPFRDAMTQFAPYDIDGGANLGYYMKRPDGQWTYRKRTWESGWSRKAVGELHDVLIRNFDGWSFRTKAM